MAPEIMIVKNNPNVTEWSLEKGYKKPKGQSYPIRVFNAKPGASLIAYIRLYEQDLEYLCRGSTQGLKVILHTPGEIMKMSRQIFRIPRWKEAEIAIKPKLITTSNGLRNYKPSQRQCFFTSERRLRFFKLYAQNNCEVECLANYTKIECNCSKFSMPSESNELKIA